MTDSVRVLIADDHPLVLGALRQAVSGAVPGAAILEAADFESMASTLEAHPETDLVLLDLSMPGVRGFSGLLYLRAERPGLPVIVVSGNEDRAVMRHCLEFGAAAYLPKSLDVTTMRTVIRAVLEGGQQLGQALARAGRLARLGVVACLPSHGVASFDQSAHINLIIEHYREPLTFQPGDTTSRPKNIN